ncbi:hypothetical protein IT575_10305 [bacterium]|nr:hypothetical protein [bacterium]
MNRSLVKRWLNEYLDGEIGLADKAELERLMAENPQLREEYQRLRQLGLMLGNQPEISVHPSRFRARVSDALEEAQRPLFSPQRAFALAMVVALIVIGLSMSMLVYQQGMLGRSGTVSEAQPRASLAAMPEQGHSLVIETGVGAERYFSRLLLSNQLGLIEASTIEPILSQTRVYEGAVCNSAANDPLFNLHFQRSLGQPVSIKTNAHVARSLGLLAQELSGRMPTLMVRSGETSSMPLEQFSSVYGEDRKMTVVLLFNAQH